MRAACVFGLFLVTMWAPQPSLAQTPVATSTYRIFLKDGQALASYGDAARVGDRMVFNLPLVGPNGQLSLQLLSLPVTVVDVERTSHYAESMRASYYAATRGEADYAAMTAAVRRDLAEIARLEDRQRQLLLAEQTRQRLAAWPREHFRYRAKEAQQLTSLVSDVVNELRGATVASSVSLDLSMEAPGPSVEPLMAAPEARETVELAVRAALVADIGEDRIAVLRAAAAVTADDVQRRMVARRLEQELRAEVTYASLTNEFTQRADAAVKAGSVRTIEQLLGEVLKRDQQLGFRRPQRVQMLVDELESKLESARERRGALDRYAAMYSALMSYEQQVRPAFSGLNGLGPVLGRLRDMQPVAFEQTTAAEERLGRLQTLAENVTPPADLAGVHATLVSALRMAREACARRRQADVTRKSPVLRESSAAAAGAMLLAERARADLVTGLSSPRDR